ncbi:MAG TPA: PilZ domain-containing protein [Candidatus Acidoferrales bacterium]|nr:PilZ domain-containing protein [Candidatus Acidoferrales bacterium]
MHPMRRSGRIARELPILLLGTDTLGRVFAEPTTTVVLSRHGAGILSSHRFSPEEPLTIRLLAPHSGAPGVSPQVLREADIRIVGQMGDRQGLFVYGVEFLDPRFDFWQIEFPPPEESAPEPARIALQCSFCDQRDSLRQNEIEADVFAVSGFVLRHCATCGMSTPWKLAEPPDTPDSPDTPEAPEARAETSGPRPPSVAVLPSSLTEPSGLSAPPEPDSAYSADFAAPRAALSVAPSPPSSLSSPEPPKPLRKDNRRQHVRTRVAFTACIRHVAAGDEIVECENVSKGGLCFRSRKRYPKDAPIEVAAPYSPGSPAIFLPACIKHVQEIPASALFRYGVMYVKEKKSTTSAIDSYRAESPTRYW